MQMTAGPQVPNLLRKECKVLSLAMARLTDENPLKGGI